MVHCSIIASYQDSTYATEGADQQEALEIAMKLETAPVEDNFGIAQIQVQLAEMALELRDMKNGKSIHEEVWFT